MWWSPVFQSVNSLQMRISFWNCVALNSTSSTFRMKKKKMDPTSDTIPDKIPPLLLSLESADDARNIMSWARELRNSTSLMVRNTIFINRHLTKAEALAAYNDRCRRRSKNQNNAEVANAGYSLTNISPSDGTMKQNLHQPSNSNNGEIKSQISIPLQNSNQATSS